MADQYCKDTASTTDSIEATGSMASSVSPPGLANKLSSDASATARTKFSLELRDLEAAAILEALGRVPETQQPGTEVSTLEMSTDSEVTFRKVLGVMYTVLSSLDACGCLGVAAAAAAAGVFVCHA